MQVELRRSGVEHAATSSTARFTRTGGGICPPGLRATQIMRGTMRMTATLRINNIAKILGVIASNLGDPGRSRSRGGARQALSRRSRSYRKRTARTLHWLSNQPLKLIADACGFGNGLRRLPLTTYRMIRFRPSGVSRAFLCTFIQSSRKSLKPRNSSFLGRDRIKAHIHLADNNFGAC